MLLLPGASVNAPPATSMVVAPDAVGVNVAVYTVELTALKALSAPLSTEISPTTKFVVASDETNTIEMLESFVVDPSVTPEVVLFIVIVGTTLS